MNSPEQSNVPTPPGTKLFAGEEVRGILCENGWIAGQASAKQLGWCERAGSYLGHTADRKELQDLLGLVFRYDAQSILAQVESHSVLSRTAAREVLRQLALQLLDGGSLDSELFKKIVTELREKFHFSGREVFQPLRLALAGRAGEGELDRVILLLDEAAMLEFNVRVKPARERIVEFCAALD